MEKDITKLDKEYLMSIISEKLDATELAESAYDYADETDLLELEKGVMAQYRTVEDLWTELEVETQDDILINNNWGEEFTEEELLSKYDVEDLWDELDDKSKREITGITLGTNYATSLLEKNTNIQDIIDILKKYTGITLEEIISKGSVRNETRKINTRR